MIKVLAGSENDVARIARAVGKAARIVTDAAQFTNGDGPVECLILGCRHPIPAERIELLRDIERKRLWIPLILVTDRDPEAVRRLSDVKTSAVVWFADLETELPLEIEAARGSVPLLRLAEQAGEASLPRALRAALPYSLRAAVDRPVRSVKEATSFLGPGLEACQRAPRLCPRDASAQIEAMARMHADATGEGASRPPADGSGRAVSAVATARRPPTINRNVGSQKGSTAFRLLAFARTFVPSTATRPSSARPSSRASRTTSANNAPNASRFFFRNVHSVR